MKWAKKILNKKYGFLRQLYTQGKAILVIVGSSSGCQDVLNRTFLESESFIYLISVGGREHGNLLNSNFTTLFLYCLRFQKKKQILSNGPKCFAN